MKQFSFDTIENFDEHINKSIPNYDILLKSINSISQYFISKDSRIYDLGCSTGKLLKSLDNNNIKIGYDEALLMPKNHENVTFSKVDLNADFEVKDASVVYSIFTMQFLNIDSRQNYCETVYRGLKKGGAFILCEKIFQESGFLQEVLSFSHYDYKHKHFTSDEIISKERDLRYIMKPLSYNDNIELLKKAGFTKITQFWQSYNFIGLIAIK